MLLLSHPGFEPRDGPHSSGHRLGGAYYPEGPGHQSFGPRRRSCRGNERSSGGATPVARAKAGVNRQRTLIRERPLVRWQSSLSS